MPDNTATITDQKFDAWAIVELFGHKRIAGRVREHEYGGCAFVRVDAPKPGAPDEYDTHLYGQGAIYGMHFVSETVARAAAARIDERPISSYDLPAPVRRALIEYDDATRRAESQQGIAFENSGEDDDDDNGHF
jgi:hypothetical protein